MAVSSSTREHALLAQMGELRGNVAHITPKKAFAAWWLADGTSHANEAYHHQEHDENDHDSRGEHAALAHSLARAGEGEGEHDVVRVGLK